jgi:pyruvate,water dikinase
MVEQLCFTFSDLSRHDVPLAGGKGANLGDMVQAGMPVPPGFVVPAPAYQEVLECNCLNDKILSLLHGLDCSDSGQLRGVESRIRALFHDCVIPDHSRQAILDCYRSLGYNLAVAVRSSATAEDLAGASFAGQQETFLNVSGEEALLNAVRKCWSSLFTSQAIFYRSQQGFDDTQVSMAVVIQRMINSAKSGVSFTVEPVMRNPHQMVIECVWGLGEGIVSGTITPDHYRVNRETYELVFEFVPEKKIMYSREEGGGVVIQDVPPEMVSARVLAEDELRQLVDLGNEVEEHFGCPQDIEWAIEDDTIYLLQSRPITSL